MKFALAVLLSYLLATSALSQRLVSTPRFEDYPVTESFSGKPLPPVLETPDELKFHAVIRDGVSKGWGVFDGAPEGRCEGLDRTSQDGTFSLVLGAATVT